MLDYTSDGRCSGSSVAMLITRLLRDPLTHFIAIGGSLFLIYWAVGRADPVDPKRIVVDEPALLTFIQYRSKTFEPRVAAARLRGLSDAELKTLIDDFVQEEVLYREALGMGLDKDDYVIRRRLVQKVEFVTEQFAGSAPPLAEDDLRRYFAGNASKYYAAPLVTFTHVFFDAQRRGWPQARRLAKETLETLNRDGAGFADATRFGDRYLYNVNYVEREHDDVASHFGAEMADAVFALSAAQSKWQGPFESPYGVHLVLLTQSIPGRTPPFDEIRERIVADAERERLRSIEDQALQAIVDSYSVDVDYQPPAARDGGPDDIARSDGS